MDESLRAQIETSLTHLDGLIRRGRQLRETLATDPTNKSAIAATRVWHEECGAAIHQLSGGSKAHWLARSFSEAFLMRSADGAAVEGTAPDVIVARLLSVLDQAVTSLTRTDDGAIITASTQAPPPHRFDFVHNLELRPVLEQAYIDSRDALEIGDYEIALMTSAGILESIVTDALEHKGVDAMAEAGMPAGKIADWSFEARLAVAEKMGIIRGGCARLPAVAKAYRDAADPAGEDGVKIAASERDARKTGQVLHVVMRDLNPGR